MGATRRSEWICLRCRKTNPPADGNISDEDEEEETGQDVGKMLKEMAKKWDGFEKKVSKKLDDFEANLNFYGEKVEQSCTTLKNLEQKLIAMEKRIDKTETENRELKTRLRTLEIQIQENTQKDFMNMMEISGIQNKEADPKVVTNIILEKAGYQPNEIKTKVEKVTKKVGEDKKEKTVITVKFESQEVMEIKAKNDGPILDVQFEQHELPNVTSSMLLRSATEKEVYNIMKNMKKTGQGSDGIRNGDVVRNAATLTPLVPPQFVSPLTVSVDPDGAYETSISSLRLKTSRRDFIGQNLRLRCTASIHDVYWKTTEKATVEDVKHRETNHRGVETNHRGVETNHHGFETNQLGLHGRRAASTTSDISRPSPSLLNTFASVFALLVAHLVI
ncbi:hypothetical protein M8J75_007527 [Diaphorina citri]|nr:hypothetical protein M8J75_007527 [Diaphorina citri]